ncbi:MAG: YHS domain-containing (seleno)protein [Phycisphaerae bacterium]
MTTIRTGDGRVGLTRGCERGLATPGERATGGGGDRGPLTTRGAGIPPVGPSGIRAYRMLINNQWMFLLMACALSRTAVASADDAKREPALGGHCPVCYFEKGQAQKGAPAHQVDYLGELYYFCSAEAKKKFETVPDKYLPQLGGLCTMALGGPYGNRMPGDPAAFAIVDGRLYLFFDQRAKQLWEETPRSVILRAHELFEQPRLRGYCPVSYLRDNKAVKGNPSIRSVYKTYVYYMQSRDAKKAFDEEPEKYIPPYWKYCTTYMADHLLKYFDPKLFRVVDGRTYFFHDEEARKKFDANPAEIIRKADARWSWLQPK